MKFTTLLKRLFTHQHDPIPITFLVKGCYDVTYYKCRCGAHKFDLEDPGEKWKTEGEFAELLKKVPE